jgi:predicted nucleotidyltransferase
MIDIDPQSKRLLLSLIAQFLPGVTVWAFGSRVTAKSRPASDLDLVVFSTQAQHPDVLALRETLDESDLPFRVDILEWDVLPENFQQNIAWEHTVLAAE